jgi:ATP-dependent DNA helicase RecG
MLRDLLLFEERVKNTIALGESHFREFKSALEGPADRKRLRKAARVAADIAEALVAFANADGGELIIGVEDDGRVTGVPHSDDDVAIMLNAFRSHVHAQTPLPLTAATRLTIDGKRILFFAVSKGATEVFHLSDGRCVQRRDTATMPAAASVVLFDRQEIRSREYDRQFVDGAVVADLDLPLIRSLADGYLRGLSAERYLQQLGLAEYTASGIRVRMAALLLFAQDIQRWHPRSHVRILRVAGTQLLTGEKYNVISDEIVAANVFELLAKAWEKLRPELSQRTELRSDAKFEQSYIYPEWACRETLVNAIAHRDYSLQNGIDVFIFTDRLEVRSPGELLSTVSIDDIRSLVGAHESRNALIAKVLRENKLMRELGEGMKRIFGLMQENELQEPVLSSSGGYFTVSLAHKSLFDVRQETWLSLFDAYSLTSLQRRIVVAGIDARELSTEDLYAALKTSDRSTYDREVGALRNANILVEIRSKGSAFAFAKKRGISQYAVARFRVRLPGTNPSLPQVTTEVSLQREAKRAVVVRNLNANVTPIEVESLFTTCGHVEHVEVARDIDDSDASFAIVRFIHAPSVPKALNLDGSSYDGRILSVFRMDTEPSGDGVTG